MSRRIWLILTILFSIFLLYVVFLRRSNHIQSNVPQAVNQTQQTIQVKQLTLDQIYSSDHSVVNSLPSDKVVTVTATGDVIPARVVNQKVVQMQNPLWPYLKTADVLKSADITFINLETPLLHICPIITTGFTFCGTSENVNGLTFAGVDVASLANNHAGNFGLAGIKETQNLLQDHGIEVTGIDQPVYKMVKGQTFAFIGFNDIGTMQQGISFANENNIKTQIHLARQKASVVVVTFHWGIEYQPQPDQMQIDLAHLAIDSGADLIIGNHPHWIQPVEIYKGKLITYAHGNFVFDQMWSEKTRQGVIGKYTFYNGQLIDVQFLPIQIDDWGQPHFMDNPHKDEILNDMYQQSLKLQQNLVAFHLQVN